MGGRVRTGRRNRALRRREDARCRRNGVVLAAHDPELDRPVAIKVIHGRRADTRESSARLVREAQALARVSDPHVVPVYDVGMVDGRICVAMELVQGRTLRAWLRDGPHWWTEVVEVMRQAGRGLLAVHETGAVGTRHIELARAARDGVAAFADVEPDLHASIDRWLELHDPGARGRVRRSTTDPSGP